MGGSGGFFNTNFKYGSGGTYGSGGDGGSDSSGGGGGGGYYGGGGGALTGGGGGSSYSSGFISANYQNYWPGDGFLRISIPGKVTRVPTMQPKAPVHKPISKAPSHALVTKRPILKPEVPRTNRPNAKAQHPVTRHPTPGVVSKPRTSGATKPHK